MNPTEDAGDDRENSLLQELEKITHNLRCLELKPGDILIEQGSASDVAFFLSSGEMLAYASTSFGMAPLATLRAPRLIGEIGALANLARTASVKATSDARVFPVDRAQLGALGAKSPDFFVSVIRQMGQEIASINKALALYAHALGALERRDFNEEILRELSAPPPQLAEFTSIFRNFATQIAKHWRQQDELASAALIQRSLLPKDTSLPEGQDIEIRARIQPARQVGGDFYDFFMLNGDRLVITIGDVCGKGIPASLFMTVVLTVLRMAAREEGDAAMAVARANALLCQDNDTAMFATAFFGILNMKTGILDYCNCGQNAPVFIPSAGAPVRLGATGLPLGLMADRAAGAASIELRQGDSLFLFTDGVTEACNPAKEEFGELALLQTLQGSRDKHPAELIRSVFEAVEQFAEGAEPADDITCLALRRRAS